MARPEAGYLGAFWLLEFAVMRQALRTKGQAANRQQISAVQSYSAPTGGWNARDALPSMSPNDAVRLVNWWPRTTDLIIRGGHASHATGITGVVETLAVYNSLSGTRDMFAATDAGVWDVSSAGAVGAAEAATSTNGRWQWVNFGDGTNNYLIMVNGTDKPLYYNGTTWIEVDGASSPALTGVTTTTLINLMVFKGRLMFIQNNSLSFWYLSAGSAGGALTEFDLSAFCRMGGYLVAMASWSFDGGAGPEDNAVFVTSEGEIIVYQGTNPSDASAWSLIGVYYLGKPIGRRCLTKYGGDIVMLTQNGAFPLSAALQSASIDRRIALTDKIEKAFTEASNTYGGLWGWEGTLFPAQSALIFNIPTAENTSAEQYVMNTITKAWTKFDSWNANTFVEFNKELYFGGSMTVYKAWTGTIDDTDDIIADAKTAFSYFGRGTQKKKFNLFQPVLRVNGPVEYLTGMDVDFRDEPISGAATYSVTSGAQWDVSNWDEAYWAASLEIVDQWTSPQRNIGYAGAGKLKIATNSLTVEWIANNYVYEAGGIL